MQRLQIQLQMSNKLLFDPIDEEQDGRPNKQQFLQEHLLQTICMD
jgi:hypothetical protein